MVGYNPGSNLKLSERDYAVAGAVSSIVARAVGQPLDVLKIRFQLQIEPTFRAKSTSKYHGIYQAVKSIVREEGLRALWKGHVPAQLLSVGYGVVQYTTFEKTTALVWQLLPEEYTTKYRPITHMACGSFSACCATAAIHPLDVIRTRFVAQGRCIWQEDGIKGFYRGLGPAILGIAPNIGLQRVNQILLFKSTIYTSLFHAGRCIWQADGVRGFYRGLGPAMLGIAPNMGLQFGLYATFQGLWNFLFRLPQQHHPGPVESLVCGSGSGIFAKLAIYPLDLIKKRLQIQGFQEARKSFGAFRKYSGLVHCFITVAKEEGILGLYKGLVPSLMKAGVVSGTLFCVYDQTCYMLSVKNR